MTGKLTDNPYYVEYEDLLKKHHRLIAEGKGESEEADAVRDEMDRPERELSREELAWLNGLSADLYVLQDDEIFETAASETAAPDLLAADLDAAWHGQNWERVLELLRMGPAFISRDRVAYMRSRAYEELGHPDTARLFMDYAAELNPGEPLYNSPPIEHLSRTGRHK
jgi:hypothetical protein